MKLWVIYITDKKFPEKDFKLTQKSGNYYIFSKIANINTFSNANNFKILEGFILDDNHRNIPIEDNIDIYKTNNGNFSFLNINFKDKVLECYSDIFGTKNIFYFINKNTFIISNDINQIVRLIKPINLEEGTLYNYLYNAYLNTTNLTFFKNIYQLKQHEVLRVNFSKAITLKFEKYYRIKEWESNLAVDDALNEIENNITNYLKAAIKIYDKPVLSISSGYDSNLVKKIYEKNIGPIPTVTHSFNHPDYDEFNLLKKKEKLTEINYVVKSYDDVMSSLSSYILKTGQPFAGLPTIGTMKITKFAKDLGANGVIQVIGDGMWFPLTIDNLDIKLKTAEGKIIEDNDFITEDFKKRVNIEGMNNIEIKFGLKSRIKEHSIMNLFVYRVPKALYDSYVDSIIHNIDRIQAYLNKKNLELMLSLKNEVLNFGNQPKSLIVTLLNRLNGKPFERGLTMISPQRELIRTIYRDSIIKLINESFLVKDGFVDRKKLLRLFKNYCDQSELGNSFFIWRFITSEIWYRLYFYGIKSDLYPTFNKQ